MADISGLTGTGLNFYTDALNSVLNGGESVGKSQETTSKSFEHIFSSAMDMIKQTDKYAAEAEEEAINFSLGNTESTHELTIAQQKAYLSLQYTVAVKNALLDAYKEIMNIQI